MPNRVMQGEAQARQRLATTGRYGQRIKSFGPRCRFEAMLRDIRAQSIDGLALLKRCQVRLKPADKHCPVFVAPMHPIAGRSGFLEVGRIDAVGVNQATEQEPNQQADLLLSNHALTSGRFGHADFGKTALQGLDQLRCIQKGTSAINDLPVNRSKHFVEKSSFRAFSHPFAESILAVRREAVDQPRMVRSNAQRQHLADETIQVTLIRKLAPDQLCAGGRVIYPPSQLGCIDIIIILVLIQQSGSGLDVGLELMAVLSEVVQQTKKLALILKSDLCSKSPGVGRDPKKVILQRLLSPVGVPDVRNRRLCDLIHTNSEWCWWPCYVRTSSPDEPLTAIKTPASALRPVLSALREGRHRRWSGQILTVWRLRAPRSRGNSRSTGAER